MKFNLILLLYTIIFINIFIESLVNLIINDFPED